MNSQNGRDDADVSASNVDGKQDRYKDPNRQPKSSSKSKDLSHVPCKFFKVGSCTAGQSCPFSHQIQQPGQAKDVCAWFVKGNCKFGHKCALAHILPGQSPSMDRRNKKAAQLAAAAVASGNSNNGVSGNDNNSSSGMSKERDRERDSRTRKSGSASSGAPGLGTAAEQSAIGHSGGAIPSRSNSLLSGSAPPRVLAAGGRALPISISKAAPAPAETAPALRDADFTSRDTVHRGDDRGQTQNGLNIADGEKKEQIGETANSSTNGVAFGSGVGPGVVSSPAKPMNTSPFPVSTPPRPHRFAARHGSSPSIDFGPVGSPPRASPLVHGNSTANNAISPHLDANATSSTPIRINGFSPGTSPMRDPIQGTQPLAAAAMTASGSGAFGTGPGRGSGTPNMFIGPSSPRGSGVAASLSLGAQVSQHAQPFAVGSLPLLSRPMPPESNLNSSAYSEALDDEDMEDFVPGSLKDLLTPEEQNRRMSRTSSSHLTAGVGAGGIQTSGAVARSALHREGLDSRHRHSRSVPSTSLLSQNLRSIWSDNGGELGSSDNPGFGLSPSAGAGFASSPGLQHAFEFDKESPSPSMLSPTNASAAFLGMGMHAYMGTGTGTGVGTGARGVSAMRAVSQGNVHHHPNQHQHAPRHHVGGLTNAGSALGVNPPASSSFDPHRVHGRGFSSSPSHVPRSPFDFDTSTSAAGFSSSPSKFPGHLALSPHRPVPSGPITSTGETFRSPLPLAEQALSPGSRALQAHVPGQSLPQGLAAGISRIHLQPAVGAAFSPGSASASGNQVGSGEGVEVAGGANGGVGGAEWLSATPMKSTPLDQQPSTSKSNLDNSEQTGQANSNSNSVADQTNLNTQPDVSGLTNVFSHFSYSSVAALRSHPAHPASPSGIPAVMSRRSSGRGGAGWPAPHHPHPHPLSSPLSGPVLTNDDDELFTMDEEK